MLIAAEIGESRKIHTHLTWRQEKKRLWGCGRKAVVLSLCISLPLSFSSWSVCMYSTHVNVYVSMSRCLFSLWFKKEREIDSKWGSWRVSLLVLFFFFSLLALLHSSSMSLSHFLSVMLPGARLSLLVASLSLFVSTCVFLSHTLLYPSVSLSFLSFHSSSFSPSSISCSLTLVDACSYSWWVRCSCTCRYGYRCRLSHTVLVGFSRLVALPILFVSFSFSLVWEVEGDYGIALRALLWVWSVC